MMTNVEPQRTELSADRARESAMHKPIGERHSTFRFLSDCTPYLYLTGAFAAFFATLYIVDWFWLVPHSLLIAAGVSHLALALRRKSLGTGKH